MGIDKVSDIVLRLRVFDHHESPPVDRYWQRVLETDFLPTTGDDVLLWGLDDGPAAPVRRRWWRPDGRVCVELASVSLGGKGGGDPMKDGRLQWLPMGQTGVALAKQLRSAGWEMMT